MTQSKPSKPGNVAIKKVGHTYDNRFGNTPTAQERGKESATEQTFGKGA